MDLKDEDKTKEQLIEELAELRRERRQAEEVLRKSEERMTLAIEGANDAVWDWDVVGNARLGKDAGV